MEDQRCGLADKADVPEDARSAAGTTASPTVASPAVAPGQLAIRRVRVRMNASNYLALPRSPPTNASRRSLPCHLDSDKCWLTAFPTDLNPGLGRESGPYGTLAHGSRRNRRCPQSAERGDVLVAYRRRDSGCSRLMIRTSKCDPRCLALVDREPSNGVTGRSIDSWP